MSVFEDYLNDVDKPKKFKESKNTREQQRVIDDAKTLRDDARDRVRKGRGIQKIRELLAEPGNLEFSVACNIYWDVAQMSGGGPETTDNALSMATIVTVAAYLLEYKERLERRDGHA